MEKYIPVFVHHETGDKKQAGFDKTQNYIKACISKATDSGNTVFLFGDETNKEWSKIWIDFRTVKSSKWDRFEKVFENMSTYPLKWSKSIFHRFFVFEQYATDNNIAEFFVLDSDVLLYEKITDLCDWKDIDVAAVIPQKTQLGNEFDNDLRWTVNLGTSYWKTAALSDFLEYCIESFMFRKDILNKKWEYHKKYNYPGGICEMSLAYLWIKENKNFRFINLVNSDNMLMMFNNDINGMENYGINEYQFNPFLNIKKIKFISHKPFFISQNNEMIRVANIHFGGDAKLLMNDLSDNDRISLSTLFVYSFYLMKKNCGIIYRKIKRNISRCLNNV